MIDLILGAMCEVRSIAHTAEHGGLWADSAWHVARGELPTCERSSDTGSSSRSNRDDDGSWRRDKFGFGCSWRGCG